MLSANDARELANAVRRKDADAVLAVVLEEIRASAEKGEWSRRIKVSDEAEAMLLRADLSKLGFAVSAGVLQDQGDGPGRPGYKFLDVDWREREG